MQEVAYLVHTNGDIQSAKKKTLDERFPFIDFQRPGDPPEINHVEQMQRPRLLKTHLYSEFFAEKLKTSKAKVIVVIRNPKDALVSYYHFYRYNF